MFLYKVFDSSNELLDNFFYILCKSEENEVLYVILKQN